MKNSLIRIVLLLLIFLMVSCINKGEQRWHKDPLKKRYEYYEQKLGYAFEKRRVLRIAPYQKTMLLQLPDSKILIERTASLKHEVIVQLVPFSLTPRGSSTHHKVVPIGKGYIVRLNSQSKASIQVTFIRKDLQTWISSLSTKQVKTINQYINHSRVFPLYRIGTYMELRGPHFRNRKGPIVYRFYPDQEINMKHKGITLTFDQSDMSGLYGAVSILVLKKKNENIKIYKPIKQKGKIFPPSGPNIIPDCYKVHSQVTSVPSNIYLLEICGAKILQDLENKRVKRQFSSEKGRALKIIRSMIDIFRRHMSYYTGLQMDKNKVPRSNFGISGMYGGKFPYKIKVLIVKTHKKLPKNASGVYLPKDLTWKNDTILFEAGNIYNQYGTIKRNNQLCELIGHELMHLFLSWCQRHRSLFAFNFMKAFFEESISTWAEEQLCETARHSYISNHLDGTLSMISWNVSQENNANVHWNSKYYTHDKGYGYHAGHNTYILYDAFAFRETFGIPFLFLGHIENPFDFLLIRSHSNLDLAKYLKSKSKFTLKNSVKSDALRAKGYLHFVEQVVNCNLFKKGSYYRASENSWSSTGEDKYNDTFGVIQQEVNNPYGFYKYNKCSTYGSLILSANFTSTIDLKDTNTFFTNSLMLEKAMKSVPSVVDKVNLLDGDHKVYNVEMLPYSTVYHRMSILDKRSSDNKSDYEVVFSLYMKYETLYGKNIVSVPTVWSLMKNLFIVTRVTMSNSKFYLKRQALYDLFFPFVSKSITIKENNKDSKYIVAQYSIPINSKNTSKNPPVEFTFAFVNGNRKGYIPNCDVTKSSCNSEKINFKFAYRGEIRKSKKRCKPPMVKNIKGNCSCKNNHSDFGSCPIGTLPKISSISTLSGSKKICECVSKCKINEYYMKSLKSCVSCPPENHNPYFFKNSKPIPSKKNPNPALTCTSCQSKIRHSKSVFEGKTNRSICLQSGAGDCLVSCKCPKNQKLVVENGKKVCLPPCSRGQIWDEETKSCKSCEDKIDFERRTCISCPRDIKTGKEQVFFKAFNGCGPIDFCDILQNSSVYNRKTQGCQRCPKGSDRLYLRHSNPTRTKCLCSCTNKAIDIADIPKSIKHCGEIHGKVPTLNQDEFCCTGNLAYHFREKKCKSCPDKYFKSSKSPYCIYCDIVSGFQWNGILGKCECLSNRIEQGLCRPICKSDEMIINNKCHKSCSPGMIRINGRCYWKPERATLGCACLDYNSSWRRVCSQAGFRTSVSCANNIKGINSFRALCYCKESASLAIETKHKDFVCIKNRQFTNCEPIKCQKRDVFYQCIQGYTYCCPPNTRRVKYFGKTICK